MFTLLFVAVLSAALGAGIMSAIWRHRIRTLFVEVSRERRP